MTSRTTPRAVLAAAGLAMTSTLLTTGTALAGGGPENVLVIVDPTSMESLYIANYYKTARNIPDANMLYLDPDASNYAEFTGSGGGGGGQLDGFMGNLQQRLIDDHIDFVVVAPGANFSMNAAGYITDGCFPVTKFSIASVFTTANLKSIILPGNLSSQTANQYFSIDMTKPLAFDSNTSWLSGSPSSAPNARRYFIGAMLGYTGERGNTVSEVLAMIERSVDADGTRPGGAGGGKFYLMDNKLDGARNVRFVQYASATPGFTANGGASETILAELPIGKNDVLGVITGFASTNITNANFTMLPGSFADHLTSYAAEFNTPDQTKCSEWIAKGASGTAGTVDEPCNYQGKFPHTRQHVYYLQGMSMGEAWFRGHAYVPFQALFLGDPITRLFTHIPTVNVTGVPAQPVGGTIQITPTASTTKPGASIAKFDLLIDGVTVATTTLGQKFTIDTNTLTDGWHDLRVVATDNTLTKNTGRWTGSLNVNNHGLGVNLQKITPSGNLTQIFQLDIQSSGATAQEVRLLSNGRVVASRQGNGSIFIWGMNLGAGDVALQAETTFDNGEIARSPMVTLPITFDTSATSGLKPIVFGYTKEVRWDAPAVIELPATMDTNPAQATYEVVTPPAQAAIAAAPGVTGKPARVIYPSATACGEDSIVFRVTTPSGQSNNAIIKIRYVAPGPASSCEPDCDQSGSLTIDDFICFQTLFALGDRSADADGDCALTISDFIAFQTNFALGC